MELKLDPWGAVHVDDYSRLFDEFGISSFADILPRLSHPHPYMRRKIIFGHRNYDSVLHAIERHEPFAVMSGFMPTGRAHFGHMMVMNEIIWHQQQGGDAFAAVADMEAHAVRGISWGRCRSYGIDEYLVSLIALGFEPGPKSHIYFQSEDYQVRDLAFELGREANFSEVSAIYGFSGETHISHMESVMVQSADILHPQLEEYGGPKPVVIPVGADQDPHIKLTRDLAYRMRKFLVEPREGYISIRGKAAGQELMQKAEDLLKEEYLGEVKRYEEHIDLIDTQNHVRINDPLPIWRNRNNLIEYRDQIDYVDQLMRNLETEQGGFGFLPPASIYHRFMTGLTGGKMSSSKPESHIALTEDPKEAGKKIMRAITGGRQSLAEQKKLGGEPEKCSIYEFLVFHLSDDDKELLELDAQCRSGQRMCGTCKKDVAERIERFLVEHQRARLAARERLPEFGIIA
ncbi:MAG TPA: tryptophan--tRNA ligase [Methanothrix sp.]|nr:tryptophan--tRNA ligase [Methanothrix sp.]